MKVVAINASARKDGNTAILVRRVLAVLEAQGIDTELLQMSGRPPAGCIACYKCFERKDRQCAVTKDKLNEYLAPMIEADAIILASPTYFADATAGMRALIERAGMVSRANDFLFARKVGAAVVSMRRGGGIQAFNSINSFFLAGRMVVPGSNYWNMGFGRNIGEVESDQEGLANMDQLGQDMAWLLHKLQA